MMVALVVGAWLVLYSPQRQTTLILPAWVVHVDVVKVAISPIILSDQIGFGSPRNYSVRIVKVTVGNLTFLAPLNSRYLRLNSSEFAVADTDSFLTVTVEMTAIRINVTETLISPARSDQTGNPDFTYYPLFRDAEIYFTMHTLDYLRIIVFCQHTSYGTLTKDAKQILAVTPNGERTLITIAIEGDMVPLDSTSVQSSDLTAISTIQNLLTQAKVDTSLSSVVSQPSIPSWANIQNF
jgi:hypothetical protein